MGAASNGEGLARNGGADRYPYRARYVQCAVAFLLFDALMLVCSLVVGDAVLHVRREIPIRIGRSLPIVPAWWLGALVFRVVPGWGTGPVEQLRRIEALLLAIFGATSVALFLARLGTASSRTTFVVAYAAAALLVPLGHAWMKGILIRLGFWGVPAAIYGNDRTARFAVEAMIEEPGLGYRPIGVFDDEAAVGTTIDGIPVLGRTSEWTAAAPVAILAAPQMTRDQLTGLVEGPLSRYRRVILIPDLLEAPSLWVRTRDFMGVLGLEISSNLFSPTARFAKYWGERLAVLTLLPLWMPVVFVVSVLIRLEDGEFPFFLQDRVGRRGRIFRVVKFRTMHPDAEAILARRIAEDAAVRAEWEAHCKLRDDPRVTRIGRLLRITSLDELPQLFNVLSGDMSLVGPRPLPPYHHGRLPEKVRRLREMVLPGVTGLWQVSGRSESGTAGMERWDSYYVRNWSIWLDVVVLFRTVRAVLGGRGAY